jgi:class 3 adenylate cyclase/predicted ATPase
LEPVIPEAHQVDMGEWLRSLGLAQYEAAFRDNEIDEIVLPDLTVEDLKELGVAALGHRRKLLAAIAALKTDAMAVPTLSSPPEEGSTRDSAERRQITVMFSDLVGSTALSTRMDPEDLREIISAYQKCVAQTVSRFDGFVAKYMGDGVLVYFGYPQAHEDDAERAVRAGLDIVAAVEELESPVSMQVRVGIATGLVVVGDLIGSGSAQEQAVVGETPNLAARLQGNAKPNTVVIAESTRRLIGDLFELDASSEQDVKGIGPVRAWTVLRPGALEGRFEALHSGKLAALLGREEETELLLRRWQRAQSGEGQVAFLSGEPGIGKSHLTAALAERADAGPHTRLRYFCSSQHTNSTLFPIVAHLERAAGIDPNEAPAGKIAKVETLLRRSGAEWPADDVGLICELLSIPVDGTYHSPDISPRKRKERTLALLIELIETIAAQHPVLMIFEDVHWIDPTSQELLVTVVDRIVDRRVLLVITARPEFVPPWPHHSHISLIALTRLGRRDGAALVDQVADGKALPAEVVNQIVSRADGVPLFLEELTKTVLEGDFVEQRNGRYVLSKPLPALAIPTTLQGSLMARLDRSVLAKEIAQIGAAIGRDFSYGLLRAVAAIDEAALNEALGKLEQANLASCRGRPPEATYSFRHALVQDAAYASLLKTRRQALHRQIAEALRDRFSSLADAEPEIIAHHFTQAGLAETAVEWWTRAGELALRRSAYLEAVAHYNNAVGEVEKLDNDPQSLRRHLRLQIARGQALISARGHGAPETTAAFIRARELAAAIDDPAERFSVYYGLWAGGYVRGEHATMEEIAGIMLREIESHPDRPESVVAYRVVGTTFWSGGDYVQARQYFEKAVAALPLESDKSLAMRFGQDPSVSAIAYFAIVLFGLGEIDRARTLAEEALGRAMRSGHTPTVVYGQFLKAVFEAVAGGADRVAPFGKATLSLGREHGMPVWIAVGTFYDSWARRSAGDLEHMISELRRGFVLCHEVGVLNWIAQMVVMQAVAEAEAGLIEDGLAGISAFLAENQPIKQRWLDAELYRERGVLLSRATPVDANGAEAAFRQALAIARKQHTKTFELRAAVALARLWCHLGKRDKARDLLAPVYNGFTEGFDTPDLKEAKRLLGEFAS